MNTSLRSHLLRSHLLRSHLLPCLILPCLHLHPKDEFLLYMLENLGLVEIEKLRLLNTRFAELEEDGILEKYKNDVVAEKKKREEVRRDRELEAHQNGGVMKFFVPEDEERVVLHEGNEHRIDEVRAPSPTNADEMEAQGRGVSQGCGPGSLSFKTC